MKDIPGTLTATLNETTKRVSVRASIDGADIYISIDLDVDATQRFAECLMGFAARLREIDRPHVKSLDRNP